MIQAEAAEALRAAIAERPDATLQELREAAGFNGCLMTVWHALKWSEWMGAVDPDRFVFLDESHATRSRPCPGRDIPRHDEAGGAGTRRDDRGDGLRGRDGRGRHAGVRRDRVAADPAALGHRGDGQPLGAQGGVRDRAIEAVGAIVCHLPPYSPDLNPDAEG